MLSNGFLSTSIWSVLPIVLRDFVPGIIGVGRADDHLQIGKFLPDAGDRFDPVPARRHAHINEGHGVGLPAAAAARTISRPFLPLKGGVDLKVPCSRRIGASRRKAPLHRHPARRQLRVARAENFAEVLVDRGIIVDDEDAVIFGWHGRGLRVHACEVIEAIGEFEGESGAVPRPALCTESEPPISRGSQCAAVQAEAVAVLAWW